MEGGKGGRGWGGLVQQKIQNVRARQLDEKSGPKPGKKHTRNERRGRNDHFHTVEMANEDDG